MGWNQDVGGLRAAAPPSTSRNSRHHRIANFYSRSQLARATQKEREESNRGYNSGDCLFEFVKNVTNNATAAVAKQEAASVWCEHCAADGVTGRSMMSTSYDISVQDCSTTQAAGANKNGLCRSTILAQGY